MIIGTVLREPCIWHNRPAEMAKLDSSSHISNVKGESILPPSMTSGWWYTYLACMGTINNYFLGYSVELFDAKQGLYHWPRGSLLIPVVSVRVHPHTSWWCQPISTHTSALLRRGSLWIPVLRVFASASILHFCQLSFFHDMIDDVVRDDDASVTSVRLPVCSSPWHRCTLQF